MSPQTYKNCTANFAAKVQLKALPQLLRTRTLIGEKGKNVYERKSKMASILYGALSEVKCSLFAFLPGSAFFFFFFLLPTNPRIDRRWKVANKKEAKKKTGKIKRKKKRKRGKKN